MKLIIAAPLLAATLLLTACTGEPASCIESQSIAERVGVAFLLDAVPTSNYGAAETEAKDGSVLVAVEYLPKDSKEVKVGLWHTDKIDGGQIYSVDENAKAVSDWGHGAEGKSAAWAADPAAAQAIACLKQ